MAAFFSLFPCLIYCGLGYSGSAGQNESLISKSWIHEQMAVSHCSGGMDVAITMTGDWSGERNRDHHDGAEGG